MAKLENWGIMIKDTSYVCDDFRYCIYGEVYDHEKYEDGTPIITRVVKLFDSTFSTAQTKDRCYQLGEQSEDFKRYLKERGKELKDFDR
jgi:hypothetical protein